jgi:hypothetical protein
MEATPLLLFRLRVTPFASLSRITVTIFAIGIGFIIISSARRRLASIASFAGRHPLKSKVKASGC